MKILQRGSITTLCVGSALLCRSSALADDAMTMDQLTKENQELKARMEKLEALAQKEGLLPSGDTKPVVAPTDVTLSGFVTASYFYDTSNPKDKSPNAYLWNRHSESFTLNKIKLVLASPPVERSADEWHAGFRASLIWGEDAPYVNTGNPMPGFEPVREAYVELNAPIGSGLDIKAGQLISLLNFESGDGGAANPNFSQGNQWFYTGNGPSAGVQLDYQFTDMIDLKVRVQNGMYAGPIDNNDAKTVMASLGLNPDSKTWVNFVGFAGKENATFDLRGGSVLGGRQFTDKLGTGFEADWFHFDLKNGGNDDDLWSIGGWVWYDFTAKVGIAFRGEYLNDNNGFGTSGLLGFPANNGSQIYGFTTTLNWKPTPSIKIQPEVRVDRTDVKNGFDGTKTRVIIGAGASYLF